MIGIIGGTGLYRMDSVSVAETRHIETPFGAPSAPLALGTLAGRPVAFLARHGAHHELIASEINYRANIWALKSVGVRTLVGVSAVGSLRAPLRPGDLALPSQYLDLTKGRRAGSFFGAGIVAHVSTAEPVCAATSESIAAAARALDLPLHLGQTYACIEGPRLGTRAESAMLQTLGADLVGMTNVPEVYLACEAQMGYCVIALVTDYDCWQDDPAKHVTAEQAMALFKANLARVQELLALVVTQYRDDETRPCRRRLAQALITPRERLAADQRRLLAVLET